MKPPTSTTVTCPDCDQSVRVPIEITGNGAYATLHVADEFTDVMTEHVMAHPQDHPTFVTEVAR